MARSGHPEVSWTIVLEAVLWEPFRRGPGATTVGDASMLTLRGRRADFDRTDLDALLESVAQELAGAGGR